MFERFTDRARRSLVLAQDEAKGLSHNFIGTEHILLGLLAEGTGVAALTLFELGLTLERTREIVADTIGPSGSDVGGKPPFTPRAKKVLELALREALSLNHNYIGTEHMLLGLLREGEGVGAQVLLKENITLSTAREAVLSRIVPSAHAAALGMAFSAAPQRASTKVTPAAIRLAKESSKGTNVLFTHSFLSTHHYLLALFEDPDSMAARALAELGVTREQVQEVLGRLDINQTSDAPPTAQTSSAPLEFDLGHGITLRIGDPDLAKRLIESGGSWDQLAARLQRLSRDITEAPGGQQDTPPRPLEPDE